MNNNMTLRIIDFTNKMNIRHNIQYIKIMIFTINILKHNK